MSRIKRHLNPRLRGFTRAQLLLLLLLLGVGVVAVGPRLGRGTSSAKLLTCQSNVALINSRLDFRHLQEGVWPQDLDIFVSNVKYFPEGQPKCPLGKGYELDTQTHHVRPHRH